MGEAKRRSLQPQVLKCDSISTEETKRRVMELFPLKASAHEGAA